MTQKNRTLEGKNRTLGGEGGQKSPKIVGHHLCTFPYLHHYPVCEFGGDDCIHTESHVDRTMFHYRDRLLTNVNSVLKKLSDRCQLDQSLKRDLLDQQS